MRYIGDVHGHYGRYKRIIKEVPASIQVGDMGVGFRHTQGARIGEPHQNPPHALMVKQNARFIRGNHDNPTVCKAHTQWIPDGHYDPETKTMFIGGTDSIDKQYRTPGYSWWADEELSYAELRALIMVYTELKPEIMVTHDAPTNIALQLVRRVLLPSFLQQRYEPSRTQIALQQMWEAHPPKLWIFGHHHLSHDEVVHGTRFICLAELEYKDL